jgi:hypothetical protein
MLGLFNSPMGQIIAPHISAKRLAQMVEEYMGFEQYAFIKDNAAIFEQAETQQIVEQVKQDMQTQQATPMEEDRLAMQTSAQQPPPTM